MIKDKIEELKSLIILNNNSLEKYFNQPATLSSVREFESRVECALPSEWQHLYLLFDGISIPLFKNIRLNSLSDVYNRWLDWKIILNDGFTQESISPDCLSIPPSFIRKNYINLGWLPFISDDVGNHIGPDMSPDFKGASGQVINFGRDQERKYVLFQSLNEMISYLMQSIKNHSIQIQSDNSDYIFTLKDKDDLGLFWLIQNNPRSS